MPELLKSVDTWFLILCVIIFGGYFLWSVRKIFADLKESIKELKDTIKELFEDRNDHDKRITTIETRCQVFHGIERRKNDAV